MQTRGAELATGATSGLPPSTDVARPVRLVRFGPTRPGPLGDIVRLAGGDRPVNDQVGPSACRPWRPTSCRPARSRKRAPLLQKFAKTLTKQDVAAQSANELCIEASSDKAITACNEAIRQNPKNDRFYGARGRASIGKRDFDQAIADFTEVIKLGAATSRTYAARGNAWLSKREHNKAIADYNEAIKLDPQAAIAYENRGSAWAYKGEIDKAIDDLNDAIRLNPQYSMAFSFRGWMLEKRGEDSTVAFAKSLDVRVRTTVSQEITTVAVTIERSQGLPTSVSHTVLRAGRTARICVDSQRDS